MGRIVQYHHPQAENFSHKCSSVSVMFEPDSLYELQDPIQYRNKAPQGQEYTNLSIFKSAETTEDVIYARLLSSFPDYILETVQRDWIYSNKLIICRIVDTRGDLSIFIHRG